MSTLLYLYLLAAAFSGGYFYHQAVHEAEEGFGRPPVLAFALLSMMAPVVVAAFLVHGMVRQLRGRIRR